MLLSNTIDLATPRVWADAVAQQLGPRTLHVITDQIGHGGFEHSETKKQFIEYLDATNRPSPNSTPGQTPEPLPDPAYKPGEDTSS